MTKTSVDPVLQLEIALQECKPAGWYRDAARNWLIILLLLGTVLFAVIGIVLGFPWAKCAATGGVISTLVIALCTRHVLAKADLRDWHEARIREATANRKNAIEQSLSRRP